MDSGQEFDCFEWLGFGKTGFDHFDLSHQCRLIFGRLLVFGSLNDILNVLELSEIRVTGKPLLPTQQH